MLPAWLKGLQSDSLLFPKLRKRRTWLMVKKDRERIGIAYETAEGIADFHAAGRHTHITELLRNGATLPEANELARYQDVKMTMRYTHIGMEDQSIAIRRLPLVQLPTQDAGEQTGDVSVGPKTLQCSASASVDSTWQNVSRLVTLGRQWL